MVWPETKFWSQNHKEGSAVCAWNLKFIIFSSKSSFSSSPPKRLKSRSWCFQWLGQKPNFEAKIIRTGRPFSLEIPSSSIFLQNLYFRARAPKRPKSRSWCFQWCGPKSNFQAKIIRRGRPFSYEILRLLFFSQNFNFRTRAQNA